MHLQGLSTSKKKKNTRVGQVGQGREERDRRKQGVDSMEEFNAVLTKVNSNL